MSVRPAGRGVRHASPGSIDPASARGRLAGLGLCRRPRGRQDAGRRLLDPAAGPKRHHEAGLPDRPDRGRYPGCDGRGPVRALGRRAAVVPAAVRTLQAPRHLAQRGPRGLLERRGAGAGPRSQRQHPLGRRIGLLAASRIDLGPGDAGTAGRHESPGLDHDNAAPAGGPAAHPGRADHRPDDRHDLR